MRQELDNLKRAVERVMRDHKAKCLSWSEQPSSAVRSKINQHFDDASAEIRALIQKVERGLG